MAAFHKALEEIVGRERFMGGEARQAAPPAEMTVSSRACRRLSTKNRNIRSSSLDPLPLELGFAIMETTS